MNNNSAQRRWERYREEEMLRAERLVAGIGYSLDERQPHIAGERYLMMQERDVGASGFKLVLLGTRDEDGLRVIVKSSSTAGGKKEIERERSARKTLLHLDFSYRTFLAPKELLHTKMEGCVISITEFIEQEKEFIERPLEEQFALALLALKTQEGVHATTYAQAKTIQKIYGIFGAKEYLAQFHSFREAIQRNLPDESELDELLKQSEARLCGAHMDIEQYGDFLTHADFVPHNLRIKGDDIYLLDYASIHFGNKYENWARFMNFMMLYHPELEKNLVQYIAENRTKEEVRALQCMRLYKLAFLLHFYAGNLAQTSGALKEMTRARITFWKEALRAVLRNERLSPEVISTYTKTRDDLRSEEEKLRQKGLH